MDQPIAPPRRFRFGLRTLLAVVTLAAVASWGYWIGWPWWQAYHEQIQFEGEIRQLKAGTSPIDAQNAITFKSDPLVQVTKSDQVTGRQLSDPRYYHLLKQFVLKNGVYLIYFKCPKGNHENSGGQSLCSSIEVFRFPPVPGDYKPRSPQSIRSMPNWSRRLSPAEYPVIAHWIDAEQFIVGGRKEDYGLQYELIYSDAPAKLEGK
jgi:hypothetical protein